MPDRLRTAAPVAAGVLIVLVAGLLVWEQAAVRVIEARMAAGVADWLGVVPARSLRTAVIFPLEGRHVGYTLAPGCTAVFVVAPFLVIGAGLIGSGRIAIARGLATLAALTAALCVVNQARLFVVAGSIRLWGFETGYTRSHVILGTVVSTIGAVGGILLFLFIVARQPAPEASRRTRV